MSYGQGGPGWTPGGSNTPDWNALAADAERRRGRRRATLLIIAAVATVVVGAVVAALIVSMSGDDSGGAALPEPSDLPENSEDAEPTFSETTLPPVPRPEEFIADPGVDTAPFTPDSFFGSEPFEIDGRAYTLASTGASEGCAEGATEELTALLAENGCVSLLRATYAGEGVLVTVGVAQFEAEQGAAAVREGIAGNLQPLAGGEAGAFCERGGCRTTVNDRGRYAVFTLAGNADGSPDRGEGTAAQQAARDGDRHAVERVVLRGEAQASASASALVEERERQRREQEG
ncbi:hypothetical protein RM780_16540 [Streptomyces sp. DSM 44917]|uniref:Uncharacterized protein n=1 Tax=Streptomyces boetiae TaxID=3075541 RepID=A0ABU2LAG9_9ACTN|nr:hypothetical protein [Streptomyces sp. DSM 44917]MDT0308553.1 hypothetical protein [Streptomyces sp. DSM 44917]